MTNVSEDRSHQKSVEQCAQLVGARNVACVACLVARTGVAPEVAAEAMRSVDFSMDRIGEATARLANR